MEGLRELAAREIAYSMCRSKLAEVLEKVLKAELIRLGWTLEKTHDLEVLFERLEDRGSETLALVGELCPALADAYVVGRYPGFDQEDPDWSGLRGQLEQVDKLLALVESRLTEGFMGTEGPDGLR